MKIYLSLRKLCKTCSDIFCVRYDCQLGSPEKCELCIDKECGDKCQHIHSLDSEFTCPGKHSRESVKCEQCCQICLHTRVRPIRQIWLFEYEFRQAGFNLHNKQLQFEHCYNCGAEFFLTHKTLNTREHCLRSMEVAVSWETIHYTVREMQLQQSHTA